MAEYIEREATVKLLRSLGSRDYRREKGSIQEAIKMVSFPEYTPSADVAQVRHGRWVDNGIPDSILSGCSVCGFTCGSSSFFYCPICGAKMDESDEPENEARH